MIRRLSITLLAVASVIAAAALPLSQTTAAFTDQGRVRTSFGTGPVRDLPLKSISAGRDFNLGVADDGTLWAWGANDLGQLGDGSTTDRQAPVRVAIPAGKQVTSASAGTDVGIAVTSDGSVYTWGSTEVTAGPTPTLVSGISGTVVGVSAGGRFFLAWTQAGNLWSWGNNGSGRLGRGALDTVYPTPGQVTVAGANLQIVGAYAGRYGAVAWRAAAAVFAWGDQHNAVTGLSMSGVPFGQLKEVVIGHDTKMLLAADGKTYWSRGTGAFALQSGLPTVADIDISLAESYDAQTQVAVGTDGSVYAWLNNTYGQFGDGTTTGIDTPRRIALTAAGNPQVVGIAAGPRHTVLRTAAGRFSGTGADDRGQLGNGADPATKTYLPPLGLTTWP